MMGNLRQTVEEIVVSQLSNNNDPSIHDTVRVRTTHATYFTLRRKDYLKIFKIPTTPRSYYPLQMKWTSDKWQELNDEVVERFGSKVGITWLLNTNDSGTIQLPRRLTGTVIVAGRFRESSQLYSQIASLGRKVWDGAVLSSEDQRSKTFFLVATNDDVTPFQKLSTVHQEHWKKFLFTTLNASINFDVILDGGCTEKVENSIQIRRDFSPFCELLREISLKEKGMFRNRAPPS